MTALTLTNLANDIYVAADTVGRELTGFIPSVTTNSDSTRAAKGDNVTAAFTAEAGALQEIGEGAMSVPEGIAQSVTGSTLQLTNAKAVQIPMGAEKEMQLRNAGHYETVYGDLIKQAMRKLTNAMEADLALEAKVSARFASGGAADAKPFASNLDALALARNELVDAGCPDKDGQISAVMNNATSFGIRTTDSLFNANTAGSTDVREQGILLNVHGINLRESGQISAHAAGTLTTSTPLTDGADVVGETSVAINGGNGTIVAGDIVNIASSSQRIVAKSGFTDAGNLVVNGSGLKATTANDKAVTLEGAYVPTSVFHRNALELAMRAPAVPSVGDSAVDSLIVNDPFSGLVFEIRLYTGYRKSLIEVAAVWGVKAWKSDFITTIVGN
tara:strand:- start:3122 stop:4285 length:1164 start_codon:yes stop_codon:yes gene_type:complete